MCHCAYGGRGSEEGVAVESIFSVEELLARVLREGWVAVEGRPCGAQGGMAAS